MASSSSNSTELSRPASSAFCEAKAYGCRWRCHESEIVGAFRKFYPRYRMRDMSRTTDGVSLSDSAISDLVRGWNTKMGKPGERTSSGYWKGVSLAPAAPRASVKRPDDAS